MTGMFCGVKLQNFPLIIRGYICILMICFSFLLSSEAFSAVVELECNYRVELDWDGNFRFDQARVGRTSDGVERTVWAEFDLTHLSPGV